MHTHTYIHANIYYKFRNFSDGGQCKKMKISALTLGINLTVYFSSKCLQNSNITKTSSKILAFH